MAGNASLDYGCPEWPPVAAKASQDAPDKPEAAEVPKLVHRVSEELWEVRVRLDLAWHRGSRSLHAALSTAAAAALCLFAAGAWLHAGGESGFTKLLFAAGPLVLVALVTGSLRRQPGRPMRPKAIAALQAMLPLDQRDYLPDRMKNWTSANPCDPVNLNVVLWWLDRLNADERDRAGRIVVRRQARAFGI